MAQINLAKQAAFQGTAFTEVDSFIHANPSLENGSIEHFIIENAANFSVKEYLHKLSVTQLLSNPRTASNPEVLAKVQGSILDYSLLTSLRSALTRKAIGAVEGVLRG